MAWVTKKRRRGRACRGAARAASVGKCRSRCVRCMCGRAACAVCRRPAWRRGRGARAAHKYRSPAGGELIVNVVLDVELDPLGSPLEPLLPGEVSGILCTSATMLKYTRNNPIVTIVERFFMLVTSANITHPGPHFGGQENRSYARAETVPPARPTPPGVDPSDPEIGGLSTLTGAFKATPHYLAADCAWPVTAVELLPDFTLPSMGNVLLVWY